MLLKWIRVPAHNSRDTTIFSLGLIPPPHIFTHIPFQFSGFLCRDLCDRVTLEFHRVYQLRDPPHSISIT